MAEHPTGLSDLLLDRSLVSSQVPALLRAAGLRLPDPGGRRNTEVVGGAGGKVTDGSGWERGDRESGVG